MLGMRRTPTSLAVGLQTKLAIQALLLLVDVHPQHPTPVEQAEHHQRRDGRHSQNHSYSDQLRDQ